MKKWMCLLMVFAMLTGILAGCGTGGSLAEPAQEPSAASEAPETAVPDTEPAADASAEEGSGVEETGPAVQKVPVELPISEEPLTYSIWYNEPFTDYVSDPAEDVAIFKLLSELTNIHLEFNLATIDTASEKFQLLFAADDLPNIITDAMAYYTGSIDDAVFEDEFLLDYSSYLADMPNYSAVLSEYPEAKRTITSGTSGAMVAFPELYKDIGDIDGYMIRQDYLDQLQMDVPETYDELHDLLEASKNEFGATLDLASTGCAGQLGAGYGINVALDNSDLGSWYIEDGQVKMGLLQEEFTEYLEMVSKWYSEGLIYQDFVNTDNGDLSGLFNGSFMVTVKVPEIVEVANQVIGTTMAAMPMPRKTPGEELHICGATTSCLMDPDTWSINSNVEDFEPILQMIDYMFSDDGFYVMNYGEEGVSYEMVDGEPQFTDLVVNNPDGLDYAHAAYLYATANRTRLPFLSDYARCFSNYTEAQWAALDVYMDDCDHANDYPKGAILDSDQKTRYNTVAADITTYISENVLKFIYGQEPMSAWDGFIDTLYDMGIETAIEAKQAAYDDYLNS